MKVRLVQAVVWLVLVALPLLVDEWQTLQLAQFITYGIFAMSLALVWGRMGLLSFGHALFFGLGAYAMALTTLGRLPGLEAAPSSWLGLVLAFLVPWTAAQVLGFFLFHGRGLRDAYFGITMLALAVLAERLAQSTSWLGGMNGLIGVPPLTLGLTGDGPMLLDPLPTYYVMLGAALAVFIGLEALLASRHGLAMTAIREDEDRLGFPRLRRRRHQAPGPGAIGRRRRSRRSTLRQPVRLRLAQADRLRALGRGADLDRAWAVARCCSRPSWARCC